MFCVINSFSFNTNMFFFFKVVQHEQTVCSHFNFCVVNDMAPTLAVIKVSILVTDDAAEIFRNSSPRL